MKIGFLGAGKMAQALAKGFISKGLTKGELIVASCAPQDLQCAEIFQSLGAEARFENKPVVEKSQILVLAVKPVVVPDVLKEISSLITPDHLLLSIAMGVTLQQMKKCLPAQSLIIRIMPNTPALVGAGASVFSPGTSATEEDCKLVVRLFNAVGTCERAPESLLDVVTALSGSGPAYIYIIIEALADGAVKMGMPRDLAYKLSAQTVLGAAKMVIDTKIHPGQLKDDVMSPGGSTAAAVHFLEQSSLRAALIGAVQEATLRCKQQATSSQ